jgi:photosystem II stability/assembly factor-like uncharacterized protein
MDTVFRLAQSPTGIYAAEKSGVFVSHDGGQTWDNAFAATPELAGASASAVTAIGHTVIAGIMGAIMRSSDGGNTWQSIGLGSPAPLVTDLLTFPDFDQNGNVAAATAEDGVLISEDGGDSWVAWNFGLYDMNTHCIAQSDSGQLFVGTESGIFRSTNRGKSWREVAFPVTAAPVLCIASTATHLYAGTQNRGLFTSDDEGVTWSQMDIAYAAEEAIQEIIVAPSQLLLLTEHHLLSLTTDSSQTQVFHRFGNHHALTMVQTQRHTLVGFADAPLQILETI